MSEPLRVLVVTNTYPTEDNPGDTPAIKDQVEALRGRGIEVDLLLIKRANRKRNYLQAATRLFLTNFRLRPYDLVHAYYGHTGLLARLQVRAPVVVTFRGSDLLGAKDGPIGRRVAAWANGVIVMSEEMKHVSSRTDAQIIPFGVNLNVFRPQATEEARHELGLHGSRPLILFPWDPKRPEKRFDIVEAAVKLLAVQGHDAELVIVSDQPREVVAKYMSACDVMALASDHEGSPMAVREAMACNLPIVSVDVGDVGQVTAGTEGCYLCDRSPMDMADKLARVLAGRRRTNGRQAMALADAEWAADQVIGVYRSVLGERPAADQRHAEEHA